MLQEAGTVPLSKFESKYKDNRPYGSKTSVSDPHNWFFPSAKDRSAGERIGDGTVPLKLHEVALND